MRQRSETMALAGWSDAGHGDQSALGICRLGYVVGLVSSTLRSPRRIIRRTSKFGRKLVRSSLGREVYALSELPDHMSMLPEFYEHFMDLAPGTMGLADCESLSTHFKNSKIAAEKFLVGRFLAIQQTLGTQELDNAYRLPGLENPADGLTKTKSGMVPLLRLPGSGAYCLLQGIAPRGK